MPRTRAALRPTRTSSRPWRTRAAQQPCAPCRAESGLAEHAQRGLARAKAQHRADHGLAIQVLQARTAHVEELARQHVAGAHARTLDELQDGAATAFDFQ